VLAGDPTSGGLQSLVSGESALFYPVMGSYLNTAVPQLTELNVAVALQPKLATVWLGANDVLKFSFSGGNPVASDSPSQMQADLTQIIKALTAKGTKVLIADLPNVLSSPQFFPQGNRLIADLATLLTPSLGSSATAAATAISTYVGTKYGVTTGGYLTESGFLAIIQNCGTSPTTCLTPPLDPSGAGSGLGGYYLTPAFAAEVAQLNAGYNQVIDAVANGSGSSVALVPITATFDALAPSTTTPGSAPNLDTIYPGAPSATLQFGGNLVSWDGLHPSDLGYAVIANTFIQAADTKLGMTIPAITNAQLNAIAAADPYNGTNINVALGEPLFPFP
jgi:lysophospholipase L1-like esterase